MLVIWLLGEVFVRVSFLKRRWEMIVRWGEFDEHSDDEVSIDERLAWKDDGCKPKHQRELRAVVFVANRTC